MIGLVKLTYDWGDDSRRQPGPGDYLRGQGVRGPSLRAYLIHSARLVKSKMHQGRYALTCERLHAEGIPADATVYLIYWYSRAKKRTKMRYFT